MIPKKTEQPGVTILHTNDYFMYKRGVPFLHT
jgi:hypothetical protein